MAQSEHHIFSFEDYVRAEEGSPIKHEFLGGQVWAMAGGSARHAALSARVIASLAVQLRGRECEVFTSDLRIRVAHSGLATYPDASVVCGALELDADDPKGHTITNPSLLVEVLSPSTEEYDRGQKREHYQTLASLQEIVLVSQDAPHVAVWRREGEFWEHKVYDGSVSVRLVSIDAVLDLADLYRQPLFDV